jgi:hypothetical protein
MKRFGLTINFRKSRLNSARNGCPFKNSESVEKSGEAPETPTNSDFPAGTTLERPWNKSGPELCAGRPPGL